MCSAKNLSVSEYVVLIKQIFNIFLQSRMETRINRKIVVEFLRMDVKLLKEGNDYSVHISNCGKWKIEHFDQIWCMKSQLTKITKKTENYLFHGEVLHNEGQVSLKKCEEGGYTNEFPYLKEYLSFKLKPIVNDCNLRVFEELLLQEMSSLKDLNLYLKFTYFRDSELLYNNHVELDDDYKYCCLVSSIMCNVVKQSLQEEFRRECLHIFGVTNFEDLDFAIKSILLPQIHRNYVKMTIQNLRDFQGVEKYL